MAIDLASFRDTFFDEAAEHLGRMEAGLLRLEASPGDQELLNDIFRSAHSIKGASATFGFDDIARFTHVLEHLLDRLRDGLVTVNAPLVDVLLRSADVLRALVSTAQHGTPMPETREAVLDELERTAHGGGRVAAGPSVVVGPAPEPGISSEAIWTITFTPPEDLFERGLDPLLLLRDLGEIGTVLETTLDRERIPALESLAPTKCFLSWRLRLKTTAGVDDIRDVFAFVDEPGVLVLEPEAPPSFPVGPAGTPAGADAGALSVPDGVHPTPDPAQSQGPSAAVTDRRQGLPDRRTLSRDGSSIRVATEKVDRLVDLVGELVIAQSIVADIAAGFTPDKLPRLLDAVGELQRNTRDLQERVMSIRMVPIGSLFGRFPRLVHDLAQSRGKQIALQTSGEETELDKGVVERLGDPLMHLVRNALDHGIETPDERLAAGKGPEGIVRLAASTQGGSVVVEIGDDGHGLDTARIRRKAIERGLIRADEPLSDEQAHMLIFQPGFSTADTVTDISGRGVGMDVVKRNVELLNGSISIENRPGHGATIRLKLPLTLAILDGQSLVLGEQVFVLPLVSIVESMRPTHGQVKTLLGRGEVVMVRGEAIPLLRLDRALGMVGTAKDPSEGLVVLVEDDRQRIALLVDELQGQQQVVIKSLDTNYRRIEGVMGATIMGDGRVALILDVPGLARLALGEGQGAAA